VCDGYVLEGDVEFLCSLEQVGADSVGDGFSLCDEFGGVELGYDGFEDFVSDGGEDSFIVILSEVLLHLLENKTGMFAERGHKPDRSWVAVAHPVGARLVASSSPSAYPWIRLWWRYSVASCGHRR